jgi:hypothetical protein
MIQAYIAALIGFLYIEWRAFSKRPDDSTFSLHYYLASNYKIIIGNALGGIAAFFLFPLLIDLQRYLLHKIDGFEEFMPAEGYPFIPGLLIGLLGSWFIRLVIRATKAAGNKAVNTIAPEAEGSSNGA